MVWYGWMKPETNMRISCRNTHLHSELEALICSMENMIEHITCQHFEIDCKDIISMITNPSTW